MKKLECGCTTEARLEDMIKDIGSLFVHSGNLHGVCQESLHYATVRVIHNLLKGICYSEKEFKEMLAALPEDVASVHKVFGMEQKETAK